MNIIYPNIDPHIPGIEGVRSDYSETLLSILFYLVMGFSTRQDIARLMNYPSSLDKSLRNAIDTLENRLGFVTQNPIKYYGLHGIISTITLTEQGKAYCANYWAIKESDLEKLNRYHQGEIQLKHTGAILSFACQARLRGFTVTVLPDPIDMGGHIYYPDTLIERDDEHWFVEVEILQRKNKVVPVGDFERGQWARKWYNQYLAQKPEYVVFCALNESRRMKLAKELSRQWRGKATDLESLQKMIHAGNHEDFFVQEWNWKDAI